MEVDRRAEVVFVAETDDGLATTGDAECRAWRSAVVAYVCRRLETFAGWVRLCAEGFHSELMHSAECSRQSRELT